MELTISVNSAYVDQIKIVSFRVQNSASGERILRLHANLQHLGLNVNKELSAVELDVLQEKIDALVNLWDKNFEAQQSSAEAESRRNNLRNILANALPSNNEFEWDQLRIAETFHKAPYRTPKPKWKSAGVKPSPPKIGFFSILTGKNRELEAAYQNKLKNYDTNLEDSKTQFQKQVKQWESRKLIHEQKQEKRAKKSQRSQLEANKQIDALKKRWKQGDSKALLEFVSLVLKYSIGFEAKLEDLTFEHLPDHKTLLVEFPLPSSEGLPDIKTVKYNHRQGLRQEIKISATEKRDLYDSVCYQLCLISLYKLFKTDKHAHLQKIGFNGFTRYTNKATGQEERATILSILVDRHQFVDINLAKVNPKDCFKSLRGVSAASLIGLSPIAPVIQLNKKDRRFIDARNVEVQDSVNLAAMGWEEFEHLVRELFEKEFIARGGEVKITQSSSDGGVDAVAFDPDPISGGKIVIQAKRYTRTVGVAAVRDLYGTTLNEGANKGILVTTSDFGPDAYKFAADKPLTLMSGANLLYLLEKHGTMAKIDLQEARKMLGLK